HGWMWWRRRGQRIVVPSVIGLVAGLIPMFVHLAMAGIGDSIRGMVLDPVFDLRPGRELPRPPEWSLVNGALQAISEGVPARWPLPAPSASQQLFLWFFAMLIVAIGTPIVGWRLLRRASNRIDAGSSDRGVALMMGGLFGAGLIQQGLQRPDSTHLAWVVCVCFSLAPVTAWELLGRYAPALRERLRWRQGTAIGLAVVMLLVICPFFTYRHYLLHSRVSVGNLPPPHHIVRGDREFWVGDYWVGVAGREVVADLEAWSQPGERLLVGPADLARTIYSDVMFYYFFPELTPATYYIEMDPGLADREGSSLAADVASADWVLLTNFWTGWNEPNASSDRGSD
ncbi:MAG TPA: hypothetical protein PLV68_14660, partial [Ilumatobacteraceae bacterium]|nr:hypothetical protein [Ilumatobacteraceae bacterium]